jgi:hypothetical protein
MKLSSLAASLTWLASSLLTLKADNNLGCSPAVNSCMTILQEDDILEDIVEITLWFSYIQLSRVRPP